MVKTYKPLETLGMAKYKYPAKTIKGHEQSSRKTRINFNKQQTYIVVHGFRNTLNAFGSFLLSKGTDSECNL